MANVFLENGHDEIETAILLEKAYQTDIENAVAFTDGNRVFINTDDNLSKILPDYNKGMLKWLLWHEEYHKQLKHHNRFYKYLDEIREAEAKDKFHIEKDEVNIIMDILVHDSLSKLFPELVETAIKNYAQMRNRNSLKYTFKTNTLEDMLDEYAKYKQNEQNDEGTGDGTGDKSAEDETKTPSESSSKESDDTTDEPEHHDGNKDSKSKDTKAKETLKDGKPGSDPEDEHDKTDWSKLEKIDTEEFIDEEKADEIDRKINELKRKKIKLGRLAKTLNGLATNIKERTYRTPSYIQPGNGVILKGKLPGKTALYLVFDASGSMMGELDIFKDLIKKSIPQAMECPCEWFSGAGERIKSYKCDYFKGKFKDIIPVHACGGYDDDGDKTLKLCLEAEKKGYTPIGVTDGGGCLEHPEIAKQLKRTIIVGHGEKWLEKVKSLNPNIQTLYVDI